MGFHVKDSLGLSIESSGSTRSFSLPFRPGFREPATVLIGEEAAGRWEAVSGRRGGESGLEKFGVPGPYSLPSQRPQGRGRASVGPEPLLLQRPQPWSR